MSVELISVLIAVLAIGVAQSGLILTSNRGLREAITGRMRGQLERKPGGHMNSIEVLPI